MHARDQFERASAATPCGSATGARCAPLRIPTAIQEQRNPIQLTSDVVGAGRAHFADHCASCHANDSGDTEMGRNLFPKARTCACRPRSR